VPGASGALDAVFSVIIVGMVSIYLVLDGRRFLHWATGNTPLRHRRTVSFFVQRLDRVMGGYIRGQLLLCLAMAILIGFGMWVIGVPFPLALAVLAFVLEFIPMIGLWLVGAAGAAGAGCRARGKCPRGQHPLAEIAGTCGGRASPGLALCPAGFR
jgi:predicted PurR-regulated permease PerM